jgi:hypothetical protein
VAAQFVASQEELSSVSKQFIMMRNHDNSFQAQKDIRHMKHGILHISSPRKHITLCILSLAGHLGGGQSLKFLM